MTLDPTRASVREQARVQTAPGAASVARGSSSFVRRAERCIGLAIRKGQEEGRIAKRGDNNRADSKKYGSRTSPTEFHDTNRQSVTETYAMTDGISDEVFDAAIEQAKAEGNLSRANVVTDAVTAAAVSGVLALGDPWALMEGEAIA